jgi:ABC-type branched-subunit amino acid transport system substrate-binding protein
MCHKNNITRSFQKYTGIFAISNIDRLVKFLEKFITTKYKNKLIILDNAKIKELVAKNNNLLYRVP